MRRKRRNIKNRAEGFYTVETAVVLSIFLMIIGTFIKFGIEFYVQVDEVKEGAFVMSEVESLCRLGRITEMGKEIVENEYDE